ncbi:MAG: Cof-type HAD-IIB family hydrolase [Cyanobacteria bacterium]|nr:Cof-type HAD-IIB family hydrolase [Cyanobacteriota bacterium]MDA0865372.1 Cof-type HAD-IIB family hydrolase [Cyanobacteriota bacterium]
MAAIRLLVLDIDGTIAGESNQITPQVQQAVAAAQAQGIQVAIATGRMYQSALRFHQAIGSTLPLMAYQGAWIQDPITQTRYRHNPLSRTYALELLRVLADAEAQQALSIHLYIDDQLHVRSVIDETRDYAQRSQVDPLAVGDLMTFLEQNPTLETTKLLALSPEPAVTQQLLGHLQQRYQPDQIYLTQSVSQFFEATHPLANKGVAVKFVAEELLGLAAEQVMAIGDNFNDAAMLQYAGCAVAMGDAPPAVQAMADWTAPSVEADGVAAAIEKFLL